MNDVTYIREEDRQEYQQFCIRHLRHYGRPPVDEVWHYTTAEGLIGILGSGSIYSTHVACLNDSLEQRYLGDLIHEAVKRRIIENTDSNLAVLLRIADEALTQRDLSTVWHFVACFGETGDDLGQWRGYGGGECGYAIGFRSQGLLEALKARPSALFMPMHYTEDAQQFVVKDILRMAEQYFLGGIARGFTDIQQWAREFIMAFAYQLDILASMTKHPKFTGERERRILTGLNADEHHRLEFRQKRTLLARHLPIDLTVDAGDGVKKLPLTRICVGPSPAKRVSQVSVGDLLCKFGYSGIPVETSSIPYRVP